VKHWKANIIDLDVHLDIRNELGADFARLLGYFREDGQRSISAIEDALRAGNAIAMVDPAHRLKGEAAQLGAEKLCEMAKLVEDHSRHCVETRQTPEEILPMVVQLRPLFEETMQVLENGMAPAAPAKEAPLSGGKMASLTDIKNS